MTNGRAEKTDPELMANSLQKQIVYRLFAAFFVAGLVVIFAALFFQTRALERSVVSKQKDIADHFKWRMEELHMEWEAQAVQLKQNLEFSRILEARRPELLNSFFLTQSNLEFNRAIITNRRGVPVLQYGVDDEINKVLGRISKDERWWYHSSQKILYHVVTVPIWLGRTETGFLSLLKPMDNAMLGHIAYPHTDLYLLMEGQPVASSLGGKGLEQFVESEGETSARGVRYTQVSLSWKDPSQRSGVSPLLFIRAHLSESWSVFEILSIVFAALVVLALASRLLLHSWIKGIISEIVMLKNRSDAFALERKPLAAEGPPAPKNRDERVDELGALKNGLDYMMATVIESEQRFREGEAVLRQSEERLQHAQRVAHVGNWDLDIVRNRLHWSEEIFRIFEMDPERFEASYETFLKAVHPEDSKRVDESYRASVRDRGRYNLEHRLLMSDGRIKYVHELGETIYSDYGQPLRSYGTVQDISERKELENEREQHIRELTHLMETLSHSQKEWQLTFDSITDLITIHDADHTIVKANKAFAECFNSTPREIVGRKCHEFFHGLDRPLHSCPLAGALCLNEPGSHEFSDSRSGRIYFVTIFPMTFPDSGGRGIIHIARDITEERDKEMRLILSERLASLGQMAAGIAHEINNPLAAIAGCAEGLLSRVHRNSYSPELFENYLKIIEEEILRCKNITSGMLSFVREPAYDTKDVDVHVLLEKTVEIIGLQGRLREIEVIKKYQEGLPLIRGSEGELRQVILVVVTNALDIMKDRGRLTLETGFEGDNIFISITDTGSGISRENISRIFDPFFTTKAGEGGTGLGLPIANKIIANHKGSINVISEPGNSATFRITLPI